MGVINVSLPSDGSTADVADYNTPINTIVTAINGNLDNANINASAAIATSKLASDAGIGTAKITDDAVTAAKIDWASTGANAGIWWEEIGRTTLETAGDTISVTPLPVRKFLLVLVSLQPTGGTINAYCRFNNDSAANYAYLVAVGLGAPASSTSANEFRIVSTAVAEDIHATIDMQNIAARIKIGRALTNEGVNTSAATAPTSRDSVFKWTNAADSITRIDVINSGTGDYAIGSEVVVLGHN